MKESNLAKILLCQPDWVTEDHMIGLKYYGILGFELNHMGNHAPGYMEASYYDCDYKNEEHIINAGVRANRLHCYIIDNRLEDEWVNKLLKSMDEYIEYTDNIIDIVEKEIIRLEEEADRLEQSELDELEIKLTKEIGL